MENNPSNQNTDTSTNNGTATTTQGTSVPNSEYTQTTVIPGRENVLVYKNTEIGWSPIVVVAGATASKLDINTPDLSLEKYAYVNGESIENLPENTAVQRGEEIQYVISIKNNGNAVAKNIRTSDSIPKGTEIVKDSITEGGVFDEATGKITWKNSIDANSTMKLSFKVKVTSNTITLIENTAKVDGKDTPSTKTPVITSSKEATVVLEDGSEVTRDAKVSETIRYTITVKNTSEVDGKTVVKDTVPDGTTFVENTIKVYGEETSYTEADLSNGISVDVPANEEIKVSFDVIVNEKNQAGEDVKKVVNKAIIGGTETPEVPTEIANIKTTKTSTPSSTPIHEKDTIKYILTATNSGNGEGSVKISDTIPNGTTLIGKVTFDGKEYTEKQLNDGINVNLKAGETKSIEFTVQINAFEEKEISIVNANAKQDDTPVNPTDDPAEKEYITVNAKKNFVDNNNENSLKPTSVEFELVKDGVTTSNKLEANESNNWSVSFESLNKYDLETGKEIKYTVKENNVDTNYKAGEVSISQNGNTFSAEITNTLKFEEVKTSVVATKVWEDKNNELNVRPDSVTFKLVKNGVETNTIQTVTGTSTENNWEVTFNELEKYQVNSDGSYVLDENGNVKENIYSVVEVSTPNHYTKTENDLTVTNTIDYTSFAKKVTVNKKWVDEQNKDHSNIIVKINLLQDNNKGNTKVYTGEIKNGATSYTFEKLPVYDKDGNAYSYQVTEEEVTGYTTNINEEEFTLDEDKEIYISTITNTVVDPENVSVSGSKTWVDEDKTSHEAVIIKLYKNGEEYKTTATDAEGNYSFTNLPKYQTNADGSYVVSTDANGNKYVVLNVYTVEEVEISDYTSTKTTSENGNVNFTNTVVDPKDVSINGTKTWVDEENAEHDFVTINLYQNGSLYKSTVTDAEGNYSFTNLPKYQTNADGSYVLVDGHVVLNVYTVEEVEVSGYTSAKEGTNFTNTVVDPENVSVSGSKTWVDEKGTNHEAVTIKLYKNGEEYKTTVTNSEGNYSFTNLPKYQTNADGSYVLVNGNVVENVYTVEEVEVSGYTSSKEGTNFTNTIIDPENVSISGSKTWVDPEGTEHGAVTINLYKNGETTAYKTTTTDSEGKYSFTNLPKYQTNADGSYVLVNGNVVENVYTVEEVKVEGYTSAKTIDQNGNVNFTNTIEQDKVSIEGTKTWEDPEETTHNTVIIDLYRDYKDGEENTPIAKTEVKEDGTYSFTDLDKYAPDGHVYEYTVKEENYDGYTSSKIEGTNNFINKINQDYTVEVSGSKTWVDEKETSHEAVTIKLYKNGEEYKTTVTDAEGNYTFTNLPKYQTDDNGNYVLVNGNVVENIYTVEEVEVSGYTSSKEGTNFTNTVIDSEDVTICGEKIWVDEAETAHNPITVKLYKNGEEYKTTTTKTINGKEIYEFTNLQKYQTNADGSYVLVDGHVVLNVYTVEEVSIEGYTSTKASDNEGNTNFTNTVVDPENVSISGSKTWIDPEGTEHISVTINLYKNGETTVYKTTTTDSEGNYSFTNLPKYQTNADGSYVLVNGNVVENVYTVEEVEVSGYTSAKTIDQNGNVNFTNTIKQAKTSISGSKTWIVAKDTTIPTIRLKLYKDGVDTGKYIDLANGTTTYSFDDLDVYDLSDGHKYEYSVTETATDGSELSDYTSAKTSTDNVINFTNTIKQAKISINGKKVWIDAPDVTEHSSVKVKLYTNNDNVKVEVEETETNATTGEYSFENLDKYQVDSNGNLIVENGKVKENVYIVEESEVPEGYTSSVDGYTITNTVKQEKTSIKVTKVWDDQGVEITHPDITINLLQNGETYKDNSGNAVTGTIESGKTEYTFENLPKYQTDENGKLKVENGHVLLNEYSVTESTVSNYTSSVNGYIITNTFTPDVSGTITITSTETTSETVQAPVDVVFVLDISGSMSKNGVGKDQKMVDAVNSAIKTIMNQNPSNRVSVVTYSSTYNHEYSNANNADELLPLGRYTAKSNGEYLTIQKDALGGYYYPHGGYTDRYDTITTNVNEISNVTLNVYGGTYTQAGISKGANVLYNATNKTYTTKTQSGNTVEITRTPVMILLSDGLPTYYSSNYKEANNRNRSGNGKDTNMEEAYYTIRTANYFKSQISNEYGTDAKFYTIGLDLNENTTLAKAILNPTAENINACGKANGTARNLYNQINKDKQDGHISDIGGYSYADGSYVGSMSSSDLEEIFKNIIKETTSKTVETRDITNQEVANGKIELTGIDTSKEFSLTIGATTYNSFIEAQNAGYIKGDASNGYYIDISSLTKGTTVAISYNK